jgi:hypothetical protein
VDRDDGGAGEELFEGLDALYLEGLVDSLRKVGVEEDDPPVTTEQESDQFWGS